MGSDAQLERGGGYEGERAGKKGLMVPKTR